MKRITLAGYLVLVHAALAALAGAWALGYLKRPNPTRSIEWTTKRSSETELGNVPGMENAVYHFVHRGEERILEIDELDDGVLLAIERGPRQRWLFSRVGAHPDTKESGVSVIVQRPDSGPTGNQNARIAYTLHDDDGDGVMEVKIVPSGDPNVRPTRYRLRADIWEPWPWPEKTGSDSPPLGKP